MTESHFPTPEDQGSRDDQPASDLFTAPAGTTHGTAHDDATEPAAAAATESGFGARLRAARQARNLDIAACAQALRLPVRVLRKLEADDHGDIDYQVYLRGYLSKYGTWLGVPREEIDAEIARLKPRQPTLVSTGGITHSRYLLDRYATAATYLVLTAVIIVPVVWLGLKGGLDREIVHLAPLDATPVAQQAPGDAGHAAPASVAPKPAAAAPASANAAKPNERPLLASMAPFSALDSADIEPVRPVAPASVPGTHSVTIDLPSPSWVEVIADDGQRLEYSLLPAGTEKTYRSDRPLEIRIGNADGSQVAIDGKPVDIDSFRRANVAHFRVQMHDGKATPADM